MTRESRQVSRQVWESYVYDRHVWVVLLGYDENHGRFCGVLGYHQKVRASEWNHLRRVGRHAGGRRFPTRRNHTLAGNLKAESGRSGLVGMHYGGTLYNIQL